MKSILKTHARRVMSMKVVLSSVQKKVMCIEMAKHISIIRELLHLNQKEFGAMCGISTDRLSRIENEHVVMTWSQALSIIAVCNMNMVTKEYLFMNNVIPKEFFQYVQQLDETIPPIYNVVLRDEVVENYNALKGASERDGTF
jgi:DNA-binding XRE family transcriptional regulator